MIIFCPRKIVVTQTRHRLRHSSKQIFLLPVIKMETITRDYRHNYSDISLLCDCRHRSRRPSGDPDGRCPVTRSHEYNCRVVGFTQNFLVMFVGFRSKIGRGLVTDSFLAVLKKKYPLPPSVHRFAIVLSHTLPRPGAAAASVDCPRCPLDPQRSCIRRLRVRIQISGLGSDMALTRAPMSGTTAVLNRIGFLDPTTIQCVHF